MSLFKTRVDNTKALKRPDHWIGTLITIVLFAGAYFAARNNVDLAEKLQKIIPS